MATLPRAVSWQDGALRLLDQTRLPREETYITCRDLETVFEAIVSLRVRGAPAIGIAAAYGLLLPFDGNPVDREELDRRAQRLVSARPTAVNLSWAVHRMLDRAAGQALPAPEDLLAEARAIHDEDAAACKAIGELGAPLVKRYPRLLTHCNAGALAVSELGTALAPIYVAQGQGVPVHVYVDETRPLLQGSRLTAWELQRAGVDTTLIADNMAAQVMSRGDVDAVIVGADRIAANGDVANKTGTLNLAILCRHYGLPFFVACPWSTVDLAMAAGDGIPIEERAAEEITQIAGVPVAPDNVRVFNPAFDVTPAELVTAIITERGIFEPPFGKKLATA